MEGPEMDAKRDLIRELRDNETVLQVFPAEELEKLGNGSASSRGDGGRLATERAEDAP